MNDTTLSPEPNTTLQTNVPKPGKFDNNKSLVLILLLIVSILAAGAAGAWGSQQNSELNKAKQEVSKLQKENEEQIKKVGELETELKNRKNTTGESNINKDAFQGVFLKSGQVYFGKITSISETQLVLENIYYLKDNGGGTDISLVKLGNELHGPEDKMVIERAQLEFFENLKDDSQTVKAIVEYEKSNP